MSGGDHGAEAVAEVGHFGEVCVGSARRRSSRRSKVGIVVPWVSNALQVALIPGQDQPATHLNRDGDHVCISEMI